MNISKQRSHVKSRVSHYTKITLLGVMILLTGIFGFILLIGVLELPQLSLFALLVMVGLIIVKYGWSKRRIWSKGAKGEKIVAKKLKKLPKKYTAIRDVKIPNLGGDIDHVVVGPTGIYVIETKNYKPTYIPDEDCWYHTSGRKSPQNPAKQVKLQASKLNDFLVRKLGKKIKKVTINPVISPINHNLILKKDIKSYEIVFPEDLVSYLSHQRKILSSKEVKEIINILAKYGSIN
ncbi:nuclease-related domain-containing protein [Methanobacterium formicicum]|uniref:NERD domain-containing protein n=1 Tax=Methanobacterium formicicum TaxID=2162 RepID=A0A089ZV47_METFO|nr:nuclease-related domain-containing protein [Methanobacterium formicicum]AIS31804.1 NERD domain-containing protein [Methanobacterium formicicum]CEL24991.1 putative membrane protein [Methanobacterium formicicum]